MLVCRRTIGFAFGWLFGSGFISLKEARKPRVFGPSRGIENAGDVWPFVARECAIGLNYRANAKRLGFVGHERNAGIGGGVELGGDRLVAGVL